MSEKKQTSASQRGLFLFLILLASLTGCSGLQFEQNLKIEYAAYKQVIFITDKTTEQIYAAFLKTAASRDLQLQATTFSGDLRTEVFYYEGKSEGVWPLDKCCWDEIVWFGLKTKELPNAKKKIVLYAHARERQNSNWPWRLVNSFDRAAPYFAAFSQTFKENMGL